MFVLVFGLARTSGASYIWSGGGGSNQSWSLPANWNQTTKFPGSVSGQLDDVTLPANATVIYTGVSVIGKISNITVTGTLVSFTVSANLTTFGSLSLNSNASLTIANGSNKILTLGGAIAATNPSTLTIGTNNTINCTTLSLGQSCSMTNSGTINTSGAISLTNPSFIINNGNISSASGTLTIGQSCSITNNVGASFTNSSDVVLINPSTITNSGTFNQTSGALSMGQSTGIINKSGGVYTATCSSITMVNPSTIDNTGTFYINGVNGIITMGQSCKIVNEVGGTFYIYNNNTINSTGDPTTIDNFGNFFAGIPQSPCIINASFRDAVVTNEASGHFTLASTSIINITGLSAGVKNVSGGIFTLQSDKYGSAAIGAIDPTSTGMTGTFNVERFLTGNNDFANRGYRLLSSPVNQVKAIAGTTASPNTFGLNYLNSHTYGGVNYPGVYTAGPGTSPGNGFSGSNKNPLVYLYNEMRPINNATYTSGKHVGVNSIATTVNGSGASATTTSKVTLSDGTTNVAIPVGNGFLMFFVGPSTRTDSKSTTAPLDATMTANGYINQGTIPVNLYYTPAGGSAGNLSYTTGFTTANAGYNMVGNPYPSTINLNQVIADNQVVVSGIPSGIDVAYILSGRTLASQAYIACTTSGTSAPNLNYVASGEGFIVHATGTGKTLTFNESEKVPTITQLPVPGMILSAPNAQTPNKGIGSPGIQNSFAAVESQDNVLTGLYMKMEKDSDTYNYCGIYFRKDWSGKYEAGDALDMNGGLPVQMSSITSDGLLASVNHMPDYYKGVNVKLYANASTDGQYKLKIEGIRNIDTLYDIYLIDHYKKDSLDIRRYGTYLFDITKADTSSFGTERFELSVRPRPLPAYRLLNFVAQKVTGGVQVSWKTVAESNYTGFVLQKQDGTAFNTVYSKQGDGSGIYTFTDPSPVTGANTYRLQQDNIVGAISLSPPITIIYNPAGATGIMNVYPNPAKATINVNVSSTTSAASAYKANIYNSAGQLMMQRSVSSNSWTQDVTQYMPGTYIIQLNDNNGNLIGKSKFIKTN